MPMFSVQFENNNYKKKNPKRKGWILYPANRFQNWVSPEDIHEMFFSSQKNLIFHSIMQANQAALHSIRLLIPL